MAAIKTILNIMKDKSTCAHCHMQPTIKGHIIFKCYHVYCKKCVTTITDGNLDHCPLCFSSKNQQWHRGSKSWFHDACSFFSRTLIDDIDLSNDFTRVYCDPFDVEGNLISNEVKLEQKDRKPKSSKRKIQEIQYIPTDVKKFKNDTDDLKKGESIYEFDGGSDSYFSIDPIKSSENATRTGNSSSKLKIRSDKIQLEFDRNIEPSSGSITHKESALVECVNTHLMMTRKKLAPKPLDKSKITNYRARSMSEKSFLNASNENSVSAPIVTAGNGEGKGIVDKTVSSHNSRLEDSNDSLIDKIETLNSGSKSTTRNPTIQKSSNKSKIANNIEKSKTEKSVKSFSFNVATNQSEATLNENDISGEVSGAVKLNDGKTLNYLNLEDFDDSSIDKSETSRNASKTKTVRKSSNRSKTTKSEKPAKKRKTLSKSSLMESYLNLQPKLFEDSLEITNEYEDNMTTDSLLTKDKNDIDKKVPIFIDLTFDQAPGKTYSRNKKKYTDSGDSNFDKMFGKDISEILRKEKEKNAEKIPHGMNNKKVNSIPKSNVAIKSADVENNELKQASKKKFSPDKININNSNSSLPCLKTDVIIEEELSKDIETPVNTEVKENEKENVPVKTPLKSILKNKSQFDASRDLKMKSKFENASEDPNFSSESNDNAPKEENDVVIGIVNNEGYSSKLIIADSVEPGSLAHNIYSIKVANSNLDIKFEEKETHSVESVLESTPKKSSTNPGIDVIALLNVDETSKISNNFSETNAEKSNKENIRKFDTGKVSHKFIPTSNVSDGENKDIVKCGNDGEGACSIMEEGLGIKYPDLKDKLANQAVEAVWGEKQLISHDCAKRDMPANDGGRIAGEKDDLADKLDYQAMKHPRNTKNAVIAKQNESLLQSGNPIKLKKEINAATEKGDDNDPTGQDNFKKHSSLGKKPKLDIERVSSFKEKSISKSFDDPIILGKNLVKEEINEFRDSIPASKKYSISRKKPKLDVKRVRASEERSNSKSFGDPEWNLDVPRKRVKEFCEFIPSSNAESCDSLVENIPSSDECPFDKRTNLKIKPKLDIKRVNAFRERSKTKLVDNPFIVEKNLHMEKVELSIPASNVKSDSLVKNAAITDFNKRSNSRIKPKLDVRRVNALKEISEQHSFHDPSTVMEISNAGLEIMANSSCQSVENIAQNFITNREIVESSEESVDIVENTSKNFNAESEIVKSLQESADIVENTSKNLNADAELAKHSQQSAVIVENTSQNLNTEPEIVKSSQESADIVENIFNNLNPEAEFVKSIRESADIFENSSENLSTQSEIAKSSQESADIVENTSKNSSADAELIKSSQESADIVKNTEPIIKSRNLKRKAPLLTKKSVCRYGKNPRTLAVNRPFDELVNHRNDLSIITEISSDEISMQSDSPSDKHLGLTRTENASKIVDNRSDFENANDNDNEILCESNSKSLSDISKLRSETTEKKESMLGDEPNRNEESACDISKWRSEESESDMSKLPNERNVKKESICVVSLMQNETSGKKESASNITEAGKEINERKVSASDISKGHNEINGNKERLREGGSESVESAVTTTCGSPSKLVISNRYGDVDAELRGIVCASEAIIKTPITRSFATPGPSILRSDGFVEISVTTSSEKKRMDSSLFSKEDTLRAMVADNYDEIISCDEIRPLYSDNQNNRTPKTDSKTDYATDGFGDISEITISEEKRTRGDLSDDDNTLRQHFSESPKELWDLTGDDEGIRPLNDEEESEDIIVNTPKIATKTVLRDSKSLEKTKNASVKLKNLLALSAHSTPYPENKVRPSSSSSLDSLVDSTPYSVQKVLPTTSEEYSIRNTPYLVLKSVPPYLLSTCFVETKKANKLSFSSSSISGRMKEEIHRLASIRNIEYSDEVGEDTTHLIVIADKEKRALRTYKYLQALSNRIYVVTMDYVRDCLRKNRLLDEALYIPLDLSGHPGPICAALGIRPLITKLRYFNFYVASFQDTKLCTTEEFKGLLRKTGACVHDHLSQLIRMKTVSRCRMVLAEKLPEKPVLDSCKENEIMIVDIDWFTEALGRQRLPPIGKTIYYFPDDDDYRRQLSNNGLSELLESDDEAEPEDDQCE